jgi:hypothetical protein
MRAGAALTVAVACILMLPACDDFQEFNVRNPCSFDVRVAFASARLPPPTAAEWPYATAVPASSETHIVTVGPTGNYPHSERVQVSAQRHRPFVDTIEVTQDNLGWAIPQPFCDTQLLQQPLS